MPVLELKIEKLLNDLLWPPIAASDLRLRKGGFYSSARYNAAFFNLKMYIMATV